VKEQREITLNPKLKTICSSTPYAGVCLESSSRASCPGKVSHAPSPGGDLAGQSQRVALGEEWGEQGYLDGSHVPLQDPQVVVRLRVGGAGGDGSHQHLVPVVGLALQRGKRSDTPLRT